MIDTARSRKLKNHQVVGQQYLVGKTVGEVMTGRFVSSVSRLCRFIGRICQSQVWRAQTHPRACRNKSADWDLLQGPLHCSVCSSCPNGSWQEQDCWTGWIRKSKLQKDYTTSTLSKSKMSIHHTFTLSSTDCLVGSCKEGEDLYYYGVCEWWYSI